MKTHHLGYVVADIEAFAQSWPHLSLVKTVIDPVQDADIALYDGGGIYFEFIRPLSSQAFTWRFLQQKGAGYHHVAFEIDSEEEANTAIRNGKLLKIRGPIPAVLFDRPVIFAATRTRQIVEFVIMRDTGSQHG